MLKLDCRKRPLHTESSLRLVRRPDDDWGRREATYRFGEKRELERKTPMRAEHVSGRKAVRILGGYGGFCIFRKETRTGILSREERHAVFVEIRRGYEGSHR